MRMKHTFDFQLIPTNAANHKTFQHNNKTKIKNRSATNGSLTIHFQAQMKHRMSNQTFHRNLNESLLRRDRKDCKAYKNLKVRTQSPFFKACIPNMKKGISELHKQERRPIRSNALIIIHSHFSSPNKSRINNKREYRQYQFLQIPRAPNPTKNEQSTSQTCSTTKLQETLRTKEIQRVLFKNEHEDKIHEKEISFFTKMEILKEIMGRSS
mgnify:CR=1 FL=1